LAAVEAGAGAVLVPSPPSGPGLGVGRAARWVEDLAGEQGLLLYRGYMSKAEIEQMCRDTARDDRGWMLPLDDSDLRALVAERKAADFSAQFPSLRAKLDALVM
jgi:hypothetical protein